MNQTIVIGVDGMEPSLWTKWADEGHLPNMQAISEEGAYGTADCSTISSAAQWTTHFTGVDPETHGVTGFERDSDEASPPSENRPSGDRELITTEDIRVATYPEVLSDRGRSVGLLNPLPLWPPVELDGGFCVSGLLTPPDADVWTHPVSLADELEQFGYEVDIRYQNRPYGFLDDDIVGEVGLETLWEDLSALLETRIEYAKKALTERDPELFYVLYKSIDAIEHAFWAPMEAGDPDHGTVIREAYAMVDEFVGWVRAERPDANVILFGDHGFRARRDPPGPLNEVATVVSNTLPTVPEVVKETYHELMKDTGTVDDGEFSIDHLSGTHDNPTAWLAAGPAVDSVDGLAVEFEDLAPTIYTLLNEPIPDAYTGTPITDALSRSPTYDDTSLAVTRQNETDEAVSERLYNLGYVDMVEDDE